MNTPAETHSDEGRAYYALSPEDYRRLAATTTDPAILASLKALSDPPSKWFDIEEVMREWDVRRLAEARKARGLTQAALGAKVEVPTLEGRAELTIPTGTQHGQMFRLGGKGLPDLRHGRRGDEIVQVLVEIPKRLNKEQEALLRQFAATEDKSVLPESKGFFDKVVEYLSGLGQ